MTLRDQWHTVLVLVAFIATLVVYAIVGPDSTLSDLLLIEGGAVAGTAGTAVANRSAG